MGKKKGNKRGPLTWCEEIGRKTTDKVIAAIKSNKSRKK
jgi:hypothetical protein